MRALTAVLVLALLGACGGTKQPARYGFGRLAAAAEIVNEPLATEGNPVLDAVRFLAPTKSMLRSLNVATPAESLVREVVPPRVPVPLLFVMVTATPETSLPKLSVT